MKDKFVEVDGRVQTQFNLPLKIGQTISIRPRKGSLQQTNYRGLEIIHENKDIIVINKEAGLLTMASNKEKNNKNIRIIKGSKQQFNNKTMVINNSIIVNNTILFTSDYDQELCLIAEISPDVKIINKKNKY